jgi:hypothetical protein
MKFGIDLTQNSSIRGLVWLVVAIAGLISIAFGKDVSQLMILGAGVAGGLGVAVKD